MKSVRSMIRAPVRMDQATDGRSGCSRQGAARQAANNRGAVRQVRFYDFTPDLFPKTPLGNLTITDDTAEITLEKRKKNGDIQFCMRMTGPANSQDRKVIITLYKDTDKCHVQVSNELLAYPVVKFTGVVRPAGE